jgi:hypothetical protein
LGIRWHPCSTRPRAVCRCCRRGQRTQPSPSALQSVPFHHYESDGMVRRTIVRRNSQQPCDHFDLAGSHHRVTAPENGSPSTTRPIGCCRYFCLQGEPVKDAQGQAPDLSDVRPAERRRAAHAGRLSQGGFPRDACWNVGRSLWVDASASPMHPERLTPLLGEAS